MFDQNQFITVLKIALTFINKSHARLGFDCVLFEFDDKLLRLVSTNGHVIALIELNMGFTFKTSIVLHFNDVSEIIKIFSETVYPELSITPVGSEIIFSNNATTHIARASNVDYVNYRECLINENDPVNTITFNAGYIRDICNKCYGIMEKEEPQLKFKIQGKHTIAYITPRIAKTMQDIKLIRFGIMPISVDI